MMWSIWVIAIPKLTGGFGFTLRYDRFSLNVFCNYRWGNKIVNMARMNAENMYHAYNQCTTVNWRWRKEGDVTDMPRAVYNQGYNWLASDRYVEDGSFSACEVHYASLPFPVQLGEAYRHDEPECLSHCEQPVVFLPSIPV